jgi:streptomycin 6-kinase
LHYGNALASDRPDQQWVATDPRPAAGAPERSTAEHRWSRADELSGPPATIGLLDRLVEHGRLTRNKAVALSFVRSIDYWLEGLANGLTIGPVRCERVASARRPLASRFSLP